MSAVVCKIGMQDLAAVPVMAVAIVVAVTIDIAIAIVVAAVVVLLLLLAAAAAHSQTLLCSALLFPCIVAQTFCNVPRSGAVKQSMSEGGE